MAVKKTVWSVLLTALLCISCLYTFLPVEASGTISPGYPTEDYLLLQDKSINAGDGQLTGVRLWGKQMDTGSLYRQDLYLEFAQPNQAILKLPADYNGGYDCTLTADDFTGDKKDEIVVSLPTGGSGGVINYLVYTQDKGKWRLIYSPVYPGEIKMAGKYLNGYKVSLQMAGIKKPIIIDLKSRQDSYDEMGIYKAGKLKEQVSPWLNADIMQITDYNRDGISEVRAHYTINGTCNADDIASVWANWKYINNRWVRQGITVQEIK